MYKVILLVCFPLFAVSQTVNYDFLSDQQLQEVLKKELNKMESQGATPDIIFKKFVVDTDAYIQSRENFYRLSVYTNYAVKTMLSQKIEDGTDTPSDVEMVHKYKKIKKEKTYKAYLEHKKTDEAKEQWENSTQNGILKLIVANHEQYTEAEQKKYDGLVILLDRNPYFSHLLITDGTASKTVMRVAN